MIEITPTGDHPVPYDLSDEVPKTHKDSVSIAVNTVDLIEELGGSIDYSDQDLHSAAALINGTDKPPEPRHITVPGEAKAAHELIKRFDFQAFADAQQARNYITNKLLQLSDCGDPKLELKALELLGKHSDVGLFTERSEVTVTHKNSSDLENSIKERIKRLLNADVVDVEPLISELDGDEDPNRPAVLAQYPTFRDADAVEAKIKARPVQKTEESEQVEDDMYSEEGKNERD